MSADLDFAALNALGADLRRLVSDSRQVQAGDVFVAYPGEQQDGRRYIPQAIAAGAAAVLWEPEGYGWDGAWNVANLPVPGLRRRIGEIAAHAYGQPAGSLWMVGITGTNGKTSCSHWTAQALTALGRPTAVVGTLGNGFPGQLVDSGNTTPDPILLQKSLAAYRDQGAAGIAMEVSSHGLDQGRVNGCRFDVALFTNLSRDHLDYHGDMARYAAAKAKLFAWEGLQHAVLNFDDPCGRSLARQVNAGAQVLSFGFGVDGGAQPMLRGDNLSMDEQGLSFDVYSPWGNGRVESVQLGRYNAANLLGVLGVLLASGVALPDAVAALKSVPPVDGRMQRLGGGDQPLVVVDYAHTPDALEKVLQALRELVRPDSRLVCVFGCGGNRDRGKRPLMAGVASRLADDVVVTSDNPRNEEPKAIIDEIIAGMGANYHVLEDRAAAIVHAIHEARPGDVVLLAGKGHETYQEIHGVRLPFSDAEVARRALEAYGGSTC